LGDFQLEGDFQFPAVSSQGCMNWFEQMLLKWYEKKNLRSLLFVAFQGLISEGSQPLIFQPDGTLGKRDLKGAFLHEKFASQPPCQM